MIIYFPHSGWMARAGKLYRTLSTNPLPATSTPQTPPQYPIDNHSCRKFKFCTDGMGKKNGTARSAEQRQRSTVRFEHLAIVIGKIFLDRDSAIDLLQNNRLGNVMIENKSREGDCYIRTRTKSVIKAKGPPNAKYQSGFAAIEPALHFFLRTKPNSGNLHVHRTPPENQCP